MSAETKKTVPARLVRLLIFLWIAVANIGVDFGLLIQGPWREGKVVLLLFLMVAVGFAAYCTSGIVDLFRETQADAENQVI